MAVKISTSDSFNGGSTEDVAKLGKEVFSIIEKRAETGDYVSAEEAKKNQENYERLKERVAMEAAKQGVSKEDMLSDTNTGLYTTVMSDFVERALRPKLLAEGVIKSFRISNKGTSAIKVPVSTLVTASALPDSGSVTYASSVDYTSATVTLGWVYAAQKISMELIEQANVDLIQDQMMELGDAIARKIDSDIIAALSTATPSNDANSNYTALGTSTDIAYATLLTGISDAAANYAEIDTLLLTWAQWKAFMSDSDVKTALGYNSVQQGVVFPMVQQFLGIKVLASAQVGANDIYLVDSKRCGYLVEASEVKVFNDRVSGALAQEVIAAKNYGVTIVQPKAVFRLKANTA